MQVSWIDETDMTALLGRLRDPVPSTKADQEFGDAGTLFEEPAVIQPAAAPAPLPEPVREEVVETKAEAHPDLEDFRSRLQAIRERAMGAGLLPQPVALPPEEIHDEEDEPAEYHPPVVEAAPQVIPQSTVWQAFEPRGSSAMERLASFAAWAEPNLRESEFFVIDDQGDMLWGSSSHQELVLTMVMAWVASSRMSAVFAFNHAPLLRRAMASGGHLLAIPCPTRLGLLHLAVTSAEPLSDEHLPELRHALIAAMEAAE